VPRGGVFADHCLDDCLCLVEHRLQLLHVIGLGGQLGSDDDLVCRHHAWPLYP
jgi:hypothetical protein